MKRASLIVFVKAPKAGLVKTRLAREIGSGRAAALFRLLTELTLSEALNMSRRCDLVLAIAPRGDIGGWRRLWPKSFRRIAQASGDLGARLLAALAETRGPVLVIGADAPALRARHLRAAQKALERADAVFGPAEDGGFWLIGLARRKRAPDLFKGVRWSTRHALADARKSLPEEFRIAYLESLRDVDSAADLRAEGPPLRSRKNVIPDDAKRRSGTP
jgi:hypothetical protein